MWLDAAHAQLLVEHDITRAEEALDQAFGTGLAGRDLARAGLLQAHLIALREPTATDVDRLAQALDAARDPVVAELLAFGASRLWGSIPGADAAPKQLVAALERVAGDQDLAWVHARSEASRQLWAGAQAAGPYTAAEAAEAAGILRDWRVSVPWGRAPLSDFERDLGPETRPLKAAETTGASLGNAPRATWSQRYSDGEIIFFGLGREGGVAFAEATHAGAAGAHVLELETNRSAALYVDGKQALRLDRFRARAPWRSSAVATLAAGARVTVKFASHDQTGFVRVRALPVSVNATAALPASAGTRVARPAKPGEMTLVTQQLLAADRARLRPDRDSALSAKLVDLLESSIVDYPGVELAAARAVDADPDLAGDRIRARKRERYEFVRERWPKHVRTLRALGRIEMAETRKDQALALWREALRYEPDNAVTLVTLMQHYAGRGWEAEAMAIADTLRGLRVPSGRLNRSIIDVYRRFGRIEDARATALELEARSPGSGATRLADLAADRGELSTRATLLARRFRAVPEDHAALRGAVAAWRAAGDYKSARDAVDAFLVKRPQDGWALSERARIALAQGDDREAIAQIDATLKDVPDFAPMESLRAWLGERGESLDALTDGRALVREFRAKLASGEAAEYAKFPLINLLDRTHYDIRPDGSTVELSHKVRFIQTKSAADALGDVKPPGGARLLAVRTIKGDGRVLWPERTEGKPDLSFPGLEPGDAVELAWVVRSRVQPELGGYIGGVSFASWNIPTLVKQAQVVTPAGIKVHPFSFHNAPQPKVHRAGDGTTTTTWRLNHVRPMPREPGAVSPRSFFPFVDLIITDASDDADFKALSAYYHDHITRLTRPGPKTREVAKQIAEHVGGGAKPATDANARARAQKVFAWAQEELDETERFNSFRTSAERAATTGKGSRAIAVVSIARSLGLEASLLLCAPRQDGVPEDEARPVPNTNRFFFTVTAVRGPSATYYMDMSRPYNPFNILPEELYGARCLDTSVAAGPAWRVLPAEADPTLPTSGWELAIDLTVDAAGDAKGTLHFSGFGPTSSGLRRAFLNADKGRQELIWQQWTATVFPGAKVTASSVHSAEDADVGLDVQLSVEVPSYADVGSEGLTVRQLARPLIANDLAGVAALEQLVAAPKRETPLRLQPHRESLELTVRGPAGMEPVLSGDALAFDLDGVTIEQGVTGESGTVSVTRRYVARPGRVTPARYPAFRAAIGGALRQLSAGLVFQPAGPAHRGDGT